MKKHEFFIGIDISKKWIDVALSTDGQVKNMIHRRFGNTQKGFKSMLKWLLTIARKWGLSGPYLFCMEHTGVYTIPLCSFLQQNDFDYVLDSALRIQRSLGIKRGKDDKADSKDIARYAYLHRKELKMSKLPSSVLMDLKALLGFRDRLVKQLHMTKVGAYEGKGYHMEGSMMEWVMDESDEVISLLRKKIKQVESKMDELVKEHAQIKKTYDLVTSVKGIGRINALQIIVHTNCFKSFDSAKQYACYIGIAPFHKKSGSTLDRGAKVSKLGHKRLKALIGNGVASAIRYDKELKAYYERKIAQGKIKYSVLNAVKNKLIARIFATVKRGTPYVEIHRYA